MSDQLRYLFNGRLIDGHGGPVPEVPFAMVIAGQHIERSICVA
jgi:hypothetical protein